MTKKVVWITGATGGLGKSLSIKFAKNNWSVAATGRKLKVLNKLEKSSKNIKGFYLEITNSRKCLETFNKIIKKFGKIDLCIFCAGVQNAAMDKTFNLKNIEKTLNTNFMGTMKTINCVYRYFKKRKKGHISILTSFTGYIGFPNLGSYGASKAALINFTESLNFDLEKHHVKVTIISPGFIKTPMSSKTKILRPMMMSPEVAADKIYHKLIKSNGFEIYFPKTLILFAKFLRIIPYWFFFNLIKIINIFIKR